MKPNNTLFYTDLFTQLDAHSLVITPTNRAATHMQREYAAFQLEKNTYSTGNILSLQTWIEKLWQQYQDRDFSAPQLLTSWQAQCVWQSVIQQSLSNEILSMREMATLAQEAWTLLQTHDIPLSEITTPYTEEVDFFKQCAQMFQARCQSDNIITHEMLPVYLAKAINQNRISLPTNVVCVGFDYFAPAIQTLLNACKKQQTTVVDYQFSMLHPEPICLALNDAQTEWLQAATWAKQQIAKNPHATIGIVIPQLSAQWNEINKTFARILAPDTFWSPVKVPTYNISAGQSLMSLPLIKAAFQILNLDNAHIHMEDLSHLLLSPFIQNATTEYAARARLESSLRRKQQYTWTWSAILQHSQGKQCREWEMLIAQHIKAAQSSNEDKAPHHWRDEMIKRLTAWGWPGELGANTIEYQTIQHFLTLLDEFALLSQTLDKISFAQALQLLTSQANNTIFQRETNTACVHILGLLEASGLRFDALWITGLHEKTFPAQLKPNPLLPIRLQLKYHMQEASHEACYQFYQKLFDRLLQSAPNVYISYPTQEEGVACEPSPFVKAFAQEKLTTEVNVLALAQSLPTAKKIELWQDEQGPPVTATESITGGTGILQAQAHCPFQAFVRYRLQAKKLEKVSLGLSALQRGQLVHDVLAKLWDNIKTQDVLLTLSDTIIQQEIVRHVEAALAVYYHHILPPLHLHSEKKRLIELISYWLRLEKNRAPFRVVAMEASHQLMIGDLSLSLRIDRIDATEYGAVILDYKTGGWGKINWWELRPEVVQLLVYSRCVENCVGVALGMVHGRQPKFAGLTEHTNILPNVKSFEAHEDMSDWDSLKQHWQGVLENLANDFCAGDASIAPKNNQTCLRCDYSGICRIDHMEAEVIDDT